MRLHHASTLICVLLLLAFLWSLEVEVVHSLRGRRVHGKKSARRLARSGVTVKSPSASPSEGYEFAHGITKQPTVPATLPTPPPTIKGCNSSDLLLCGTPNMTKSLPGDCQNAIVSFDNAEACCDIDDVLTNPCDQETASGKCRSVTIDTPLCQSQSDICSPITLTMKLVITKQPGSCCSICSCFGDPHCESFNSVTDTWLLCDARTQVGSTSECTISQAACLQQKDQNGNTCKWRNPRPGVVWNYGLQGSQCTYDFTSNQPPPEMLMYRADDFQLNLVLGDVGIIVQARLQSNGSLYLLNANDCWDDYLNGNENPWRPSDTATGPLDDPNWLPYRWTGGILQGGDRLWSVFGLDSGITVTIRCTRNMVPVNGKMRYGPPRLNIEEVVEPLNPKTQRKNAAGFCVTGVIDKGNSTWEVTQTLANLGLCNQNDGLAVAQVLCSKGVTYSGLAACQADWCKNNRPLDWQDCLLDIGHFGWPLTWCAANTIPGGDPTLCTSGNCKMCDFDILDFGWEVAMTTWSGYLQDTQVASENCLNAQDLPSDLVACQQGIVIQVESSPGNWQTIKAIPNGVTLCSNTLEFSSQDPTVAVLFSSPIRVMQCSLPDSCLQDPCVPELGFQATFTFNDGSTGPDLVALVQNNDLICDPTKWPNDPEGCITTPPPPMCPCSNSNGQLLV